MSAEIIVKRKSLLESKILGVVSKLLNKPIMFKIPFNKNIFLLIQGQLIKQVGATIFRIGSVIWLQQETNSPVLAGLFYAALALPAAILGPLGGVIVDRFPRKFIIIYSDLVISGLMFLVFMLISFPLGQKFITIILFVAAICASIGESILRPTVITFVPDLVSEFKVEGVYGFLQGSEQVALQIGLILAGILFGFWSIQFLVLINGLSFLFSVVIESFIDFPKAEKNKAISQNSGILFFRKEILEGFLYVSQKKWLWKLFLVTATTIFLTAPFGILLPFFVKDTLGVSIQWYGFLCAGLAFGAAIGGIVSGIRKFSPFWKSKIIIFNILYMSVSLILVSYANKVIPVFIILVFLGVCSGLNNVFVVSIVQRTVPKEIRGRVLALYTALIFAFIPMSMGIAGMLAGFLENKVANVFFGYGIFGLLICPVFILSKQFHELMANYG